MDATARADKQLSSPKSRARVGRREPRVLDANGPDNEPDKYELHGRGCSARSPASARPQYDDELRGEADERELGARMSADMSATHGPRAQARTRRTTASRVCSSLRKATWGRRMDGDEVTDASGMSCGGRRARRRRTRKHRGREESGELASSERRASGYVRPKRVCRRARSKPLHGRGRATSVCRRGQGRGADAAGEDADAAVADTDRQSLGSTARTPMPPLALSCKDAAPSRFLGEPGSLNAEGEELPYAWRGRAAGHGGQVPGAGNARVVDARQGRHKGSRIRYCGPMNKDAMRGGGGNAPDAEGVKYCSGGNVSGKALRPSRAGCEEGWRHSDYGSISDCGIKTLFRSRRHPLEEEYAARLDSEDDEVEIDPPSK
ncbi:hypothetical protein C8R46DRAFT_1192894 [Mycena filopes]|nr:hypothetical protein C8R46DRAFT_1192894 [Mycena filopes]